ncbi:MAG: lytic murein transglycosylase [Candidatus Puniceispirillaceae bacterium]
MARHFIALLVLCFVSSVFTLAAKAEMPFDDWLAQLRIDAAASGISQDTITKALSNVTLREKVVKLDRNQPEFKMTYPIYLAKVVTQGRIAEGKRLWKENKELLDEIGAHYGVQPRYIVALWGIESGFGRFTGGFSVVNALATMAYDGRRSAFFRKELIEALHIIDEGHISSEAMKGSWAGAMGQCQFMPSSFRAYAVDWDKDGKTDIWTNKADVFASIANYLKQARWRDDLTWGRQVKLPDGFDGTTLADDKIVKKMDEWRALGITNPDGSPLPARNLSSRLILPDGDEKMAFIAYANFDSILRWNRSNYFALAVGALSDGMAY